jgi:hypothetical protein
VLFDAADDHNPLLLQLAQDRQVKTVAWPKLSLMELSPDDTTRGSSSSHLLLEGQ